MPEMLLLDACFDELPFGKLKEESLMWWQVEAEDWLAWDFESETSLEMELEHLNLTLKSFPSVCSSARPVL